MRNIIFVLFAIAIMSLTVSCAKDQGALMGPDETLIEHITTARNVDLIAPGEVPASVKNFVNTNYNPYQIEMVYRAPGHGYEVMLENGMCIFFDRDGSHVEHDGMHNDWDNIHGDDYNCMMGDHMDVGMCPAIIQDFIHDNYPHQLIKDIVVKPSGKLTVALNNEMVLMFDPDGTLVTECQLFSNEHGMGMGQGNDGHHMHEHGFGINPAGLCDSAATQGGDHDHPWGSGNMMGHGGQNGGQGVGSCWGGESIELTDIPASIVNYLNQNYPDTELLFVMQNYHGNYMLRLEDCVRIVFDENGNLIFDTGN